MSTKDCSINWEGLDFKQIVDYYSFSVGISNDELAMTALRHLSKKDATLGQLVDVYFDANWPSYDDVPKKIIKDRILCIQAKPWEWVETYHETKKYSKTCWLYDHSMRMIENISTKRCDWIDALFLVDYYGYHNIRLTIVSKTHKNEVPMIHTLKAYAQAAKNLNMFCKKSASLA